MRPLKHDAEFGEAYRRAEADLERCIGARWLLSGAAAGPVKDADNGMLGLELAVLVHGTEDEFNWATITANLACVFRFVPKLSVCEPETDFRELYLSLFWKLWAERQELVRTSQLGVSA